MTEDTDAPSGRPSPRALALARAIKAARGEMLQVDFAVRANRPQSVVSNWETAKQTPSLETLCALEEALGLALGTLAAQAGYVTAEGAAAAGTMGGPITSRRYRRRRDALQAVRAADDLGFGVRLLHLPAADDPGGRWRVEVLPSDAGAADG